MVKRTVSSGGDFADRWDPKPGDRIIGEITRKEEITTKYGRVGILEIADNEGPFGVFCGSTVLERVYNDVSLGEVLDLTYEGEKVSDKTGNTFKSYIAEVDDGQP